MKQKIYIVLIESGEYEFSYDRNVFVTADIQKAEAWVNKFNNLLKKWKPYAEDLACGNIVNSITNTADPFESSYERYANICDTKRAYMLEVELR